MKMLSTLLVLRDEDPLINGRCALQGTSNSELCFFFFDIIQIRGSTNSRVVSDLRRIN